MSSLRGRNKKEVTRIAAEHDTVPFFPLPDECMLDLDEPYATAVVKVQSLIHNSTMTKTLCDNGIAFIAQFYTTSRSGNAHLYLKLNCKMTDMERCLIQACFRSDPTREICNMIRLKNGQSDYSICLFETPEQAKLVKQWRRENAVKGFKSLLATARVHMSGPVELDV